MAGRPILRRTCAQPIKIRVIPENEIPRALHVDIYSMHSAYSRHARKAFDNGVTVMYNYVGSVNGYVCDK